MSNFYFDNPERLARCDRCQKPRQGMAHVTATEIPDGVSTILHIEEVLCVDCQPADAAQVERIALVVRPHAN